MAGSLRRKKRARASSGAKTHKVGVTTNKFKGKPRVDVAAVDLPGALASTSWDVEQTMAGNYHASGLVSDPNRAFGRNETAEKAVRAHAVAAAATTGGDALASVLGRCKSTGAAPPKRLTPKQVRIVERWIETHGENVESMAKDRKLNAMQHTPGVVRRMLESFEFYKSERVAGHVKVDFRAPIKGKL